VALLVDEAHNLVERGRKMFSADLSQHSLRAARQAAPPVLRRKLDALQRAWRPTSASMKAAHHPLPTLPPDWLAALQGAVSAMGEYFSEAEGALSLGAEPPAAAPPPALRAFYLEALHASRVAELFDEHTLCDLSLPDAGLKAARRLSTLHLRNVVPAPHLAPRWAATHSATLFSATLQPLGHTRLLLGLPDNTALLDVGSPFSADQLRVQVARGVSTRFTHRARSLPALVQIMARQFAAQPGNYLAFFSSHDYLQQAATAFQSAHPEVPVWRQERGMSEAAQRDFLDTFTEAGQGIGFAVLGGSFGEGVDLPGRRLIGAFIATMGLPQVNPVNERLRQRLDELGRYGSGYNAVYLHPGLQKVVQAAGRVIRTTTDQGVLHLMDERYARREVRRLLPEWWGA
jgi:Rad3-related DNA helicase